MRFRWYGESISRIKGILELKEKKGSLISKTYQEIDYKFDLDKIAWDKFISVINSNLNDLLKIEFYYAYMPVIINSYYRYYFESRDGKHRITLDFNQKTYDQRIYSRPNFQFSNPLSQIFILEIKSDFDKANRLSDVTNHFPFRISQNSKYTSGIMWI